MESVSRHSYKKARNLAQVRNFTDADAEGKSISPRVVSKGVRQFSGGGYMPVANLQGFAFGCDANGM